MNRRTFAYLALALPAAAVAQARAQELNLQELIANGPQWLKENIDDSLLKALPEFDQEKADQLFKEIQKRYAGNYVIDMAALQETTRRMLPLLKTFKETAPYAAWLSAHISDFDVAGQLKLTIRPLKGSTTPPQPTPEQTRQAWQKQVAVIEKPPAAVPLVPRLKQIFVSQRVPPAMVWIAEVESGFDAHARSPVGAVGMFQLMPDTARALGLNLKPKDERQDPDRSAKAAAIYLRYLVQRFKDWRLAVAAYNAGEGRIRDALAAKKTKTFDGIANSLPAETQLYVPKLEAVIQRREGVAMQRLTVA
ncbi:MAG TPA: lytic transglycosylase domain-containing protein [Candidatus Limnocylindria bacterium]|jgi:membrane-bound lytic murein transglycosylase D|nr:lytic transglycosylase domain-containing protein [Candidatus Limnocylindria bacterium]